MNFPFKSSHKENTKAWWEERYQKSGSNLLASKEPSSFLMTYLDLIPLKGKVLEIGVGEGRNAVALALKGFDVTGIDFAATAIERAQKLADESQTKVNLRTADLDFFIPELLTYDAIISIDFKPPLTLLKNLSRGLKQGGHLFVEVPLLEAMKSNKSLEAVECYKPNELLNTLNPQSMQFQVLQYSELNPGKWGEKAFLICKKTQLL